MSEWYEDFEDIPCPKCGKPVSISVPLNTEGVDFEGAFLGAKTHPFPCPHCGEKILAEPNVQWRIIDAPQSNKSNPISKNTMQKEIEK